MLTAGKTEQPEATAAQCAGLIARCEREALREQLVPLHALHAWLAACAGDPDVAVASVAAAERASQAGDVGIATPLAALWMAKALRAAGRLPEAAAEAQRGVAWLSLHARQCVPIEFRDSFLHRNPVHRELLAWSS
jgi:hypothetical protein